MTPSLLVRRDDASRTLLTVLAVGFAVSTLPCAWHAAVQNCGLDYHTFWQVIDCCRNPEIQEPFAGAIEVYGVRGQQRIGLAAERSLADARTSIRQRRAAEANLRLYQGRIETTATPFFYAALSPLVSGDYERDFTVFVAVTLLAHVTSISLLCRVLAYSPSMTAWSVGLLSLPFLPFRSNIVVLNVGDLQLLQLTAVLALLSKRYSAWRSVTAGCLLGGSIAFKPTLAPVAVAASLVMVHEFGWLATIRFTMGCVGGAAAAWVAGCLFLRDWTSWQAWLQGLKGVLDSNRPLNPWNCSVPMALKGIVGIDSSGIVMIALLAGVAVVAYRGRRGCSCAGTAASGSAERLVLSGSLGAVIAIVASPLTWAHYYLLATPLLLWAARPSLPSEGDPRVAEWYRTLAGLALALLSVVAQSMGLGRHTNELILANLGVALLLGAGLHDLARARDPVR